MPLAQFPGERNWGYDGVYPYAVQSNYGGPRGLLALIDAAHREGLGVILTSSTTISVLKATTLGSLDLTSPAATTRPGATRSTTTARKATPCGSTSSTTPACGYAISMPTALRLDAVQTIFDFSPRHILADIQTAAHEEARPRNVRVHAIAETDQNDVPLAAPARPRRIRPGRRVVRRFSSRGPCPADRRAAGLLTRISARRSKWPRPSTRSSSATAATAASPPPPRCSRRRHRPRAVRRLHAEPRPDREPRRGRPLVYAAAAGRPAAGRLAAYAFAMYADDIHGRGIWRDAAISVFLLLRRHEVG